MIKEPLLRAVSSQDDAGRRELVVPRGSWNPVPPDPWNPTHGRHLAGSHVIGLVG
jgi:hypothetical protein